MLLGTQQAVFGIGGAIGPLAAGSLLGATGSFVPIVMCITGCFFAAATTVAVGGARERPTREANDNQTSGSVR